MTWTATSNSHPLQISRNSSRGSDVSIELHARCDVEIWREVASKGNSQRSVQPDFVFTWMDTHGMPLAHHFTHSTAVITLLSISSTPIRSPRRRSPRSPRSRSDHLGNHHLNNGGEIAAHEIFCVVFSDRLGRCMGVVCVIACVGGRVRLACVEIEVRMSPRMR